MSSIKSLEIPTSFFDMIVIEESLLLKAKVIIFPGLRISHFYKIGFGKSKFQKSVDFQILLLEWSFRDESLFNQ